VRSNAILRAVAEAAREFLQDDDWEEKVTDILGQFGRAADVCRVCIFANVSLEDGTPATQLLYEWTAPPVKPRLVAGERKHLPPQPQAGSGFERWYRLLGEGKPVYGTLSSFEPEERRFLEEHGIHSSVAMPIFVNKKWWGFIVFDDCAKEREWAETELDALRTASSILGAALERRQLAEQLEEGNREVRLLSEVLRALNAAPHVDSAFPQIVAPLRELTGCDRLSIALINDEDQSFTITSLDVPQPALGEGSRLPIDASASAEDIRMGRMHLTPDLAAEAHFPGEKLLYQAGYRSRVNVPLRVEGRVYGALNIAWKRPHGYKESQLDVLQRIADAITLAIERSYYLRRERERRESAERFYRAATTLASTLQLGDILERILDYLAEVTAYDSATILLPEDGYLRVKAMRGFAHPDLYRERTYTPDDPYFQRMAETKRPVVLDDASQAPGFEQWDEHYTIRGWAGVPLVSRNRVIGYLTLESREVGAFTPEQVQAAELFAAYAAASIEHARLYNEAVALNEELRRALQTRTKLLHHVSHELRTPLTLILGVAELLETSPDWDQFSESTQQLIEHLVREARQLRHMVNQVLSLKSVEQQPIRHQPIALEAWLNHIHAMWTPRLAQKRQTLVISRRTDVGYASGDENYLQQVLDNLLDNAHKYSPDGSNIYLSVWQEGDDIVFQIRDEGIGVAPDQLSNLFEEFYRVERAETIKSKGLGLGLALCRNIVERHGGRIWAESPGEGQGLIVTFTLPAWNGTQAEAVDEDDVTP